MPPQNFATCPVAKTIHFTSRLFNQMAVDPIIGQVGEQLSYQQCCRSCDYKDDSTRIMHQVNDYYLVASLRVTDVGSLAH
jgi:hypothetical protein